MNIPVTNHLKKYMLSISENMAELARRGGDVDQQVLFHRILMGKTSIISTKCAPVVARALGVTEEQLLQIACFGTTTAPSGELRDTEIHCPRCPDITDAALAIARRFDRLCPEQKVHASLLIGTVETMAADKKDSNSVYVHKAG